MKAAMKATASDELCIASDELCIRDENDIVSARRAVREAAVELGFGQTDVTRIVTAASELARNTFKYAGGGVMCWRRIESGSSIGLELQFLDRGPGIQDIDLALQDGFSTSGGLGMGLPGARRLMDGLEIESALGQGTTVTLRKWRRNS
jgi:serine/threonine-protein kinase RsbT